MIDILVTINNVFVEPCIVTLNSLFINNEDEKFQIHVMHYDLSEQSISKLKGFIIKRKARPFFYKVDGIDWANGKTRYWDKIILLKLYAWRILPSELNRVLYLDSDVIVLNSIRELWEMNIDGYYFAMRGNTNKTDVSGVYARHTSTGHTNFVVKKERNDLHFNAGVILMNIQELRHENPQWEQFYLDNSYRLFCPEEHLICMLWYDRILPIDDKWNHIAQAHSYVEPVILHYIPKPWSNNKDAYYLEEYLLYCDIPECESLYNALLPKTNAPYPHSTEALLCSWLQIEIKNPNYLIDFLKRYAYVNVAIYGINQYSEVLTCKMFHCGLDPLFYIADDGCSFQSYNNHNVYTIKELKDCPKVDCIIVSDYGRFTEIETKLKRINVSTPVLSLIEILYS